MRRNILLTANNTAPACSKGSHFAAAALLFTIACARVSVCAAAPNGGNAEPRPAALPHKAAVYSGTGRASWYGAAFQGRRTAGGEIFDMNNLTAAHRTMPLPSYARVTNLKNGFSLIVRVNDRGPYAHNRIIDLSQRAAQLLGCHQGGIADVKVDYLGPAPAKAEKSAAAPVSAAKFETSGGKIKKNKPLAQITKFR